MTDPPALRVWLLEPYFTGSHRAWAEGYRAASRLDVEILGLPVEERARADRRLQRVFSVVGSWPSTASGRQWVSVAR